MEKIKAIYKFICEKLSSIAIDKHMHFECGMVIALLWVMAMPCAIDNYAFAVTVLCGLAKECYDEYDYGGFDFVDWAFTALGGLFIQLAALC